MHADFKFFVSFFRDEYARSMSSAELTQEELKTRILNAKAKTKARLPWLKLARFGNKTTGGKAQCLRHDANVIEITGVELDADEMKVSFPEAVECLRSMGVKAAIYTSPSHQDDKPKWRVLAPTSKPLPPKERAKLVARLNGAMGKPVNKPESFTLSQAFFYGQAADNPAPNHQCVILEGKCIDERDDLAQFEKAGYVGDANSSSADADKNPFEQAAEEVDANSRGVGFEEILKRIGDGEIGHVGFNDALHRAAASYVALHNGNEFDPEQLKSLLREAINKAPKSPDRDPKSIERYLSSKYLNDIIKTASKKFVEARAITTNNFVAVMSNGAFLYKPTREMWPTSSVDSCIPPIPETKPDGSLVLDHKTKKPKLIPASQWLRKNQRVVQLTWVPRDDEIIMDKVVDAGGWVEQRGVAIFNLYRPPSIRTDDLKGITEADVAPYLDHANRAYPDDKSHILDWFAHRLQRPGEKINHAILLGGSQGIGKDSLVEPLKRGVGQWNFHEVSPANLMGRFNGFLKAVVLRVSETRDLGEVNKYTFYDHLKTIAAAPPDVLRIDEKNLREHYVPNSVGVILTSNHKNGVYLPPDDRRTYVAWSPREKEDFDEDYWKNLWGWYEQDGIRKVVAFLLQRDISSFNPKAPPPKTPAFREIVASGVASEEVELADLIERMGKPDMGNPDVRATPDALTITQLSEAAACHSDMMELSDWISDRANRKAIPHRLEQVGYVRVANPNNLKQGVWNIPTWTIVSGGNYERVNQKQAVYARANLSYAEQVKVVRAMIDKEQKKPMPAKGGRH